MKAPSAFSAALLGGGTASFILVAIFVLANFMQNRLKSDPPKVVSNSAPHQQPIDDMLVARGHHLFLMNCAHCHGDDARGDEGPDLHGLQKSDGRISSIIQNGIKGEMPKFSAKLNDADVSALIAFLRTLS